MSADPYPPRLQIVCSFCILCEHLIRDRTFFIRDWATFQLHLEEAHGWTEGPIPE